MREKLRDLLDAYISHPDTFTEAGNRYALVYGTAMIAGSLILMLLAEPFLLPFFWFEAAVGTLFLLEPALRRNLRKKNSLSIAAFCFLASLMFWYVVGPQANFALYIVATTSASLAFFRWQDRGSLLIVCLSSFAAYLTCQYWRPTPFIFVPPGFENHTQNVIDGFVIGFMFASTFFASSTFSASETKLRLRNRELAAERDHAKETSQAREEFLAMISHEFRTPLTTLIATVKVLSKRANMQHLRSDLRAIEASSQSVLLFFQNALDHARYSSGQFIPEFGYVDLKDTAQDVISVLSSEIERKALQISLDLAPSCPPVIVGDKTLMRQLLINIVSNAIKYTATGSIHMRFNSVSSGNGPLLRLEVEDTGIGIAADQKDHLFDLFTQDQGSSNGNYSIGLGLAICKRIVESLSGDIGVDSVPGMGSLFWAQIPLLEPDEVTQATPRTQEFSLSGLTLLLVEDHAFNRRILKELFENEGLTVTDVEGVESAMLSLADASYDLIVTDLFLREGSGIELAKKIRLRDNRTPIIAVSASANPEDHARSQAAGINEVLSKPFSMMEFHRTVARSIARQRDEKTDTLYTAAR